MNDWLLTVLIWLVLIVIWIIIEHYQRKRDLAIHNKTLEAGQQWIDCQDWTDEEKAYIREKGFKVK